MAGRNTNTVRTAIPKIPVIGQWTTGVRVIRTAAVKTDRVPQQGVVRPARIRYRCRGRNYRTKPDPVEIYIASVKKHRQLVKTRRQRNPRHAHRGEILPARRLRNRNAAGNIHSIHSDMYGTAAGETTARP